ncbi:MAG: O-antigen ligase family protein [Phycisphaerae bacterium]
MRIYVLYVLCAFLSLYAFRDWFKSLCGLILLMAVLEHPDMPKSISGIQGLNPWNVLMAHILMAWVLARRREGLVWDLPRHVNVMLALYLLVVIVGFIRMVADRAHLHEYTVFYLVSDSLIDTIKWVVPGLLVFDGCRDRRRLVMALASCLGVYLLLAVQVIRWMPANAMLNGASLNRTALKLILNEVGYHPVNMSMMLAGTSWAILAARPLVASRGARLLIVAAALVVAYGQALTGGRMGYVTWGTVGVVLCLLKWRKLLLLIPLVVAGIGVTVPGAVERMLQGFNTPDVAGSTYVDDTQVTSGRTLIWPLVIEKIQQAPLIGYGRMAMRRTGLHQRLLTMGLSFPHPHNAYLECLLDNGVVGLGMVMPFYVMIVLYSTRMFLDRGHPEFAAVGGACLALVLALLIASMGSQTFYPREGAVGLWVAIGLLLRLAVVRAGALQPATAARPMPAYAFGRCNGSDRPAGPLPPLVVASQRR